MSLFKQDTSPHLQLWEKWSSFVFPFLCIYKLMNRKSYNQISTGSSLQLLFSNAFKVRIHHRWFYIIRLLITIRKMSSQDQMETFHHTWLFWIGSLTFSEMEVNWNSHNPPLPLAPLEEEEKARKESCCHHCTLPICPTGCSRMKLWENWDTKHNINIFPPHSLTHFYQHCLLSDWNRTVQRWCYNQR